MTYYISHHGIAGQKWGVRNGPPYPLAGRGIGGKVKKKKKFGFSNFKKKTSDEKEKLDPVAEKERILREGTATEILEHLGELTNKELSDALNRVKWANELRNISKSELDKGWTNVNDVMKKVGNVKDWGRTGIELMKVINEAMAMANKDAKK